MLSIIAIHSNPISYSEKWINYCKNHDIPYKLVNCYSNTIIEDLKDCDILMWHFNHKDSRDSLVAKQLLSALEVSGKIIFPNIYSFWHFDDKVAQKYLLESIGAPLVKSYVFYEKDSAVAWAKNNSFPKVFKLRRGSSSANVRLIKSKKDALKIINKAFGRGFLQNEPISGLKERWRLYRLGKSNFFDLIEGVGRFFIKTKFEKTVGRERGYAYFQDFIENCTFDIRATVIKDKCYTFKRHTRAGDFRASGSHIEDFSPEGVPIEVVETAFKICKALKLRTVAFDFLITRENQPLLTELCYAFGWDEGDIKGFWDSDLLWHVGEFDPFGCMIDMVLQEAQNRTVYDLNEKFNITQ